MKNYHGNCKKVRQGLTCSTFQKCKWDNIKRHESNTEQDCQLQSTENGASRSILCAKVDQIMADSFCVSRDTMKVLVYQKWQIGSMTCAKDHELHILSLRLHSGLLWFLCNWSDLLAENNRLNTTTLLLFCWNFSAIIKVVWPRRLLQWWKHEDKIVLSFLKSCVVILAFGGF